MEESQLMNGSQLLKSLIHFSNEEKEIYDAIKLLKNEKNFLKFSILGLTENKYPIMIIFNTVNKFYKTSPNKIVDFLIQLALYDRKSYNALKEEIKNTFNRNFFPNVENAVDIYLRLHKFSSHEGVDDDCKKNKVLNGNADHFKKIKREAQKKIVTGKSKYFDNLDLKNFNIHKYNFLYRGDDFKTPHISIIKKDLLGKTSDPYKRLTILKSTTLVGLLFYSLNSAGQGAVFNRLDEILKGECIDKRISNTVYKEFQRNVDNLLNTNSEEYKALKLAIENSTHQSSIDQSSIDQSSEDKEKILQEKINKFIRDAQNYNEYIKQYRKDKSAINETIKNDVKDMRNYYKKSSIFHKNTLCESLKEEVLNLKK